MCECAKLLSGYKMLTFAFAFIFIAYLEYSSFILKAIQNVMNAELF